MVRLIAPLVLSCLSALSVAAQESGEDEGRLIGIWKLTCEDGPCRAYMNIQSDGKDVFSWSLTGNPQDETATVFVRLPLGAALPPGLRITGTGARPFDVPFQFCMEDGCTAIAVISSEMLEALRGRDTIRMAYFPYGQSAPRSYEVPISGFDDAVTYLTKP